MLARLHGGFTVASQVPALLPWVPLTRRVHGDLSPAPGTLAVGVSLALHVAAAGWALTLEPAAPAPPRVETQLVRAVHQAVVLQRPAAVIPALVAPTPPAPKVINLDAAKPTPNVARPPPKRRKRARRPTRIKPVQQKPAAFESATAPSRPAAPSLGAAVPVRMAAAGAGVAVSPSAAGPAEGDGPASVDPRRGHVDGRKGGDGADLSAYGARVRAAVQRRQHYPEIAEEQGLQGTVRVGVTLRPDGTLVADPKIVRSSGHRALDREAVRMVRASAPFANLPADFRAGTAELTIPIVFALEEDDF